MSRRTPLRFPSFDGPFVLCLLGLFLLGAASPQCPASYDPTGASAGPEIEAVLVASGLDEPVYVTAPAGDPRLFIVERTGRILVLQDGVILTEPFLDLSPLLPVDVGGDERGMLGLAFPPDFAQSGLFYVSYSRWDRAVVLARYAVGADPNVADPVPLATLVQVFPWSSTRLGGHIEFGPDGTLFFALGDTGAPAGTDVSRAVNGFLGKVLRVDPAVGGSQAYLIPLDNPSFGPYSRPELWALGLRHPLRFHVDGTSGMLFVGDAGENTEELDVEVLADGGGYDYGWRRMEGTTCVDPPTGCDDGTMRLPLIELPHTSPGCPTLVDGKTYHGAIAAIQDHHFYADACTGLVSSVRVALDANGEVQVVEQRDWTDLVPDAGSIDSVASFGLDGAGELYVVDPDGELFRIVEGAPAPAPQPDPTTLLPGQGRPPWERLGERAQDRWEHVQARQEHRREHRKGRDDHGRQDGHHRHDRHDRDDG